jgi:pimeloyl-ACP methyl ester carboxylesterase
VLLVPAAYAPRAGGGPSVQTPPRTEILLETAFRSDFLLWAAMRVARPLLVQSILGTPLKVLRHASAEEQDRVREVLDHVLPISPRRSGLLNDAAVVSNLERYDLERVTAPTLVIGIQDCLYGTFEPARYTASQIPGASFINYETGGHLWIGHHDEVTAAIVAFLRENQD